jgi:hypothetical protein
MDRMEPIRRHKVRCLICKREGVVEIQGGKILTDGWYYFGRMDMNACHTNKYVYLYTPEDKKNPWRRIKNPDYDPSVKRKYVEIWECEECVGK